MPPVMRVSFVLEVFAALPYWCDHELAPGKVALVSTVQPSAFVIVAFSSLNFVSASHASLFAFVAKQNLPPIGFKCRATFFGTPPGSPTMRFAK